MAGRMVVESALLARGAVVMTLLSIVVMDISIGRIGNDRFVNRQCCSRCMGVTWVVFDINCSL